MTDKKIIHLSSNKPQTESFITFKCPGCLCVHAVRVKRKPGSLNALWTWNGDEAKPTINPSVLVGQTDPYRRCHSFIKDGKIEFLNDCAHGLANQTVDLPPFDWEQWHG